MWSTHTTGVDHNQHIGHINGQINANIGAVVAYIAGRFVNVHHILTLNISALSWLLIPNWAISPAKSKGA